MPQRVTINPRVLNKYSNVEGVVPTIPSTNNHLDGSWLSTDIYDREFFVNTADKKLWIRGDNEILNIAAGSIVDDFKIDSAQDHDLMLNTDGSPDRSVKIGNLESGAAKNYIQVESNGDIYLGAPDQSTISGAQQSSIYMLFGSSIYYRLFRQTHDSAVGGLNPSDIRFKNNIKGFSSSLEKIKKLEPISFNWNEDFKHKKVEESGIHLSKDASEKTKEVYNKEIERIKNQFSKKKIGFIAQEVEKHIPEIVNTDDSGYKSIDYSKLSVILINGIKEQQNQIEKRDIKIKQLEERLEKIEKLLKI